MTKTVIGQQGEVRVIKIESLPEGLTAATDRTPDGRWIISHSESGHHHTVSADCEVMERTQDVPAGMRILYAIVREPTSLTQDASAPHGAIPLSPGLYEMRLSREYDPFAEQARRVAD